MGDLAHKLFWPWYCGNTPANANTMHTIDADTERYACIGFPPKAGTIQSVVIGIGTVAQNPTCGLKVSLQDVGFINSRLGVPDGTADQWVTLPSTRIVTSKMAQTSAITASGTSTGAKRAVTEDQPFAVVVEFNNFNAGDSVAFLGRPAGALYHYGYPQWTGLRTTSWSPIQQTHPSVVLKYTDGTYAPFGPESVPMAGQGSVSNAKSVIFDSADSPDEVGMKFTAPYTGKLWGVAGMWYESYANTAYTINLYNSSNQSLYTHTVNTSGKSTLPTGSNASPSLIVFTSSLQITAGAVYRFTIQATQTQSNYMYVYKYNYLSTEAWFASDGGGIVLTQRADGSSAWTDSTTSKPIMSIIYDSIDTQSVPVMKTIGMVRHSRSRRAY